MSEEMKLTNPEDLRSIILNQGVGSRWRDIDEDWSKAEESFDNAVLLLKKKGVSTRLMKREDAMIYEQGEGRIVTLWVGEWVAWMCVSHRDSFNRTEFTLTNFIK